MRPSDHEEHLKKPALLAPPGVKPDFDTPSDQRKLGYALVAVLLCLITLVVVMRIYTRARLLRRLSLDDYFLLFAWLAYAAGYNTIVTKLAGYGVAVHQWNMTFRQLIDYLYLFHIGTILYNIVILPLKLSIIIQVLRSFVPLGARNVTFWVAHALIWTNILFYIISTGLTIFACEPAARLNNPTGQRGRCLDSVAVNIASASLNSLSNALLLFLTQQVIWKLSLPRKRKFLLSIAFLGGILSLVSAVVRLVYLIILDTAADATYYSGLVGLWAFLEITFGFLVACLPVVRGFFTLLRDSSAVSALRALLYSTFMRQRPSLVSSSTTATVKGGVPSLRNAAQPQYQSADPHVSDIEYHELVVNSRDSWVSEGEPGEEVTRPWLVARPPRMVVRPQKQHPRETSQPA
ncbi:hypothetical protein DM02DRAFT_82271 [Periconia macrospinosa]|uniref:Rhodopsin domain-containing protein n=1 Tax=Periconia macrospinosa TaxID=97972 RepID=A0A2V1DIF8_9PLEO|nr:hypothetical protein DM02DRAFT_82271 [Periconia macrospinosa]